MLNQFEVTNLNCRLIVFKEQCLIESLSTQGMDLWDFFQGKGPLVTEEKVCIAYSDVRMHENHFAGFDQNFLLKLCTSWF